MAFRNVMNVVVLLNSSTLCTACLEHISKWHLPGERLSRVMFIGNILFAGRVVQ